MTEKVRPKAVESLEISIHDWPNEFAGSENGKEMRTWLEETIRVYAPSIFGLMPEGDVRASMLDPDEEITASFPCFVDDNAASAPARPGAKVRARGKWGCGLMVLTDQSMALAHDMHDGSFRRIMLPYHQIKGVNKLRFAFSTLSITSADEGYELLVGDRVDVDRILFRVAMRVKRHDIPALLRGPAQ